MGRRYLRYESATQVWRVTVGRDALLNQPGDNQVCEADGGGAGTEKEDPRLQLRHPGDEWRYARRAHRPGRSLAKDLSVAPTRDAALHLQALRR